MKPKFKQGQLVKTEFRSIGWPASRPTHTEIGIIIKKIKTLQYNFETISYEQLYFYSLNFKTKVPIDWFLIDKIEKV
jgi:hypothetical protein